MMEQPRPPVSDRAVGKGIVLAATSFLIAWLFGKEDGAGDPFWLNLLAATIIVVGSLSLYEFLGYVIGKVVARTPLAARRRGLWWLNRPRATAFAARDAFILLGAYLAGQITAWLLVGVVAGLDDRGTDSARFANLVAPGILFALACGGAASAAALKGYRVRTNAVSGTLANVLGLRRVSALQIGIAATVGLVLAVAFLLVSANVPVRQDVTPGALAQAAQSTGLPRVAWAIAAVLLAPFIEELLFRGALFEGLLRSWGIWVAASLVTAIFVVMHLPESWHYWPAIMAVAALAMVALGARVATGSTWPAVAVHFAYNATLVTAVYIAT